MLRISLGSEFFDEDKQEFIETEDFVLELEHSLVSLSKWEQKWEVPFLGKDEKTKEQVLSYVEMMILNSSYPPGVLSKLSDKNLDDINEYIAAKMTATWFNETGKEPQSRETITNELVYYWMANAGIPFECETWHLNRLFTLLKVWNVKNAKPKKHNKNELLQRNRMLNEQRKAQLKTTG